jgi:hypothetical protein
VLRFQLRMKLRQLRADGCYHITDEMIWARPTDWVAAEAPEGSAWPSDPWRSEASREKNRQACKARHARMRAQKGRLA